MSNQSNSLAPDSPFAPTGRVVPLKTKKEKLPTGFYRRAPGGNLYWRRSIDGVDYNESTGFVDIKQAQRWADDKVEAVKYGNLGWSSKGMPTVQQYYDQAKRTAYDKYLLAFVKAHAKIKMNQITDDLCRAWMDLRLARVTRFGRPPEPGSVRTECAHLRAFFGRACGARRYLRENPWRGANPDERVKLPQASVSDDEAVLLIEDQEAFIAALGSDRSRTVSKAMVQRLAQIVIGSGLRREEICYLTPAMVHHEALYVSEAIAKRSKPRTVPVGDDVLAWLEAQREDRGLGPRSTERLFVIDMEYLDELFQKASARSGVSPTVTPHTLRRTYASRMAFKVPPKVLQKLLGHADIKTTMKSYVKVNEAQMATVVRGAGNPLLG